MDPANRRHDGSHGEECFGCRVQTISFDPYAMPSRLTGKPPRRPNTSFNAGIARDERGIPIRVGGEVVGTQQYANNRKQIDAGIKALKQGHEPAPLKLV